ncbi:MAG TPA: hypothetical protein DEQ02_00410 [Ruminococcaceae bacterium]|nr:hypothetical protein [Oscillospiraceae bacterium]
MAAYRRVFSRVAPSLWNAGSTLLYSVTAFYICKIIYHLAGDFARYILGIRQIAKKQEENL